MLDMQASGSGRCWPATRAIYRDTVSEVPDVGGTRNPLW